MAKLVVLSVLVLQNALLLAGGSAGDGQYCGRYGTCWPVLSAMSLVLASFIFVWSATPTRAIALYAGSSPLLMLASAVLNTYFPADPQGRLLRTDLHDTDEHPHWSLIFRTCLASTIVLVGRAVIGHTIAADGAVSRTLPLAPDKAKAEGSKPRSAVLWLSVLVSLAAFQSGGGGKTHHQVAVIAASEAVRQ